MEYINNLPIMSNIDEEIERVYRRYLYQCDNLKRLQEEIDKLRRELAYQEDKIRHVNHEISCINTANILPINKWPSPNAKYNYTCAKFHNLSEIFYPTQHNISSLENLKKSKLSEYDIADVLQSMCSFVCVGDIVYLGSMLKNVNQRFAIVSAFGEIILHDDLMTIVFDKSINSYNPVPYEFITDRNIKYGKMFQYIVQNKDNPSGKAAYKCSFDDWRTKEEVEEVIHYYVEKGLWM
tara:strand:+ start:259 stop:969 length:711 start_codon:yes stop_codon:yes gene_type:complete